MMHCRGDVRSTVHTLTVAVRLPLSFAEADAANKAEESDRRTMTMTMTEIQSALYRIEPKPSVRFIHFFGGGGSFDLAINMKQK